MSFAKPLANDIDGSEYNNKLARMKFTKSDLEEADEYYAELGDKSHYFNPELQELFSYDNNQSMYQDLKDDLKAIELEKYEGVGANRRKVKLNTFAGTSKYFNPEVALVKLQGLVDELKEKPKKQLTEDEVALLRSFGGAKPFINSSNNKRSFVVNAPDCIQEKLNSVDPVLQREGREEFILLKNRIIAFNQDPHKTIIIQKGPVTGSLETEVSTIHNQPNSRDHFHMKVGGHFTDENGVLKTLKIKWSNFDDGNGYAEALEKFIHNDPVLLETFGDSLKSYSVFSAQGSATQDISIPSIATPSTTQQPATQGTGVNILNEMIQEHTQTGRTDFTKPDDLPLDDEPNIFEQSQNKAIQSIVNTDTEKQAENALSQHGFGLKEPTNYEGEELEADTRNLLDSINKQISEVNRMYADVVKEKILPLMHANNALVTSQELVLTNKKLVVANKSNASKIVVLEDKNNKLNVELATTKETIETQNKEIEGYISKNSTLSSTVEDLNNTVVLKNDEIKSLEEENVDLESKLNHSKGRYKQALAIASKRKTIIDSLEVDINNKTTEITSLKDSISEMKKNHKEEIEKIDTENALQVESLKKEHEKTIKDKDKNISNLESEKQSLNASIKALNDNITQLTNISALKEQTISTQNTLIDNNKTLITSQSNAITEKDKEIVKLQEDIKVALGYKTLAEKVPTLEKELKETKEVKDESGKLLKEFLKIAGDHIPKEVFEEMIKKSGTSLIDSESIEKIYKNNKNAPKNG